MSLKLLVILKHIISQDTCSTSFMLYDDIKPALISDYKRTIQMKLK